MSIWVHFAPFYGYWQDLSPDGTSRNQPATVIFPGQPGHPWETNLTQTQTDGAGASPFGGLPAVSTPSAVTSNPQPPPNQLNPYAQENLGQTYFPGQAPFNQTGFTQPVRPSGHLMIIHLTHKVFSYNTTSMPPLGLIGRTSSHISVMPTISSSQMSFGKRSSARWRPPCRFFPTPLSQLRSTTSTRWFRWIPPTRRMQRRLATPVGSTKPYHPKMARYTPFDD